MPTTAEVGVFGGSGFYGFLDDVEEVEIDTPYGKPSAPLVVGEIDGKRVVFCLATDAATSCRLIGFRTGRTSGRCASSACGG